MKVGRLVVIALMCNIVLTMPSYAGTTGSDPKPRSATTLDYLVSLRLFIAIAWPH